MMEIGEIKKEREDDCDLVSEIKVENMELHEQKYPEEVNVKNEIVVGNIGIKEEDFSDYVLYDVFDIKEEEEDVEVNKSFFADHTRSSEFKCVYCDSVFLQKHNLAAHVSEAHSGFPIEFTGNIVQCTICLEVCEGVMTIRNHAQKNHQDGTKRLTCAHCGMMWTSINHLRQHMRCHVPDGGFYCKICAKNFRTTMGIRRHTKNNHTTDVKCQICEKIFNSKFELNTHIALCHNEQATYKCYFCSKIFKFVNQFKQHMKVHNLQTHLKCPMCPKKFKNAKSYMNHMQDHQLQVGANNVIRNNEELTVFKNQKEESRKVLIKQLQFCKDFGNQHSGKRPCSFCGETFSNKHYCTKTTLYKCHLCPQTFDTEQGRENLLLHLNLVHDISKAVISREINMKTPGRTTAEFQEYLFHHILNQKIQKQF